MTKDNPRMSEPTIKVLKLFLANSVKELAGADVAKASKLASGTLYPILFRLEKAGWLYSRWEQEQPEQLGRPRRRLYTLTALGERRAKNALHDLFDGLGDFQWA